MSIKIKKKITMKTKSIRLEPNQLERLKQIAEQEGVTVSDVIRTAVDSFLNRLKRKIKNLK